LLLNNIFARQVLRQKCYYGGGTSVRTQTSPWVALAILSVLLVLAVAQAALELPVVVVALSSSSPRTLAFLTLGILSHGSRLPWPFPIDFFVFGSSQSLLRE